MQPDTFNTAGTAPVIGEICILSCGNLGHRVLAIVNGSILLADKSTNALIRRTYDGDEFMFGAKYTATSNVTVFTTQWIVSLYEPDTALITVIDVSTVKVLFHGYVAMITDTFVPTRVICNNEPMMCNEGAAIATCIAANRKNIMIGSADYLIRINIYVDEAEREADGLMADPYLVSLVARQIKCVDMTIIHDRVFVASYQRVFTGTLTSPVLRLLEMTTPFHTIRPPKATVDPLDKVITQIGNMSLTARFAFDIALLASTKDVSDQQTIAFSEDLDEKPNSEDCIKRILSTDVAFVLVCDTAVWVYALREDAHQWFLMRTALPRNVACLGSVVCVLYSHNKIEVLDIAPDERRPSAALEKLDHKTVTLLCNDTAWDKQLPGVCLSNASDQYTPDGRIRTHKDLLLHITTEENNLYVLGPRRLLARIHDDDS